MDTAKLFLNGQSQAVRLPKDYRFQGNRVYLKRLGNFSSDFMHEREQPPLQERESPFA